MLHGAAQAVRNCAYTRTVIKSATAGQSRLRNLVGGGPG